MTRKRPHYLVDGYNLIYVWQEINTEDLATARESLIRNLQQGHEAIDARKLRLADKNPDGRQNQFAQCVGGGRSVAV